jgi:hypothetical protein
MFWQSYNCPSSLSIHHERYLKDSSQTVLVLIVILYVITNDGTRRDRVHAFAISGFVAGATAPTEFV